MSNRLSVYEAQLEEQLESERLRTGVLVTRITELQAKLTERGLTGTLLLDMETVQGAPKFFALLALLLRSAGMKVVICGIAGDDKLAAAASISFNDFHLVGAAWPQRGLEKHSWALQYLRQGPVIWPDLDFARWSGLPSVDRVQGLTILNMGAVTQSMLKPGKVGIG